MSAAAAPDEVLTAMAEACFAVTGSWPRLEPGARIGEDLGLTSLQRFEVLIALEERWDVELVDRADIARATTVAELARVIALIRGGG